MMSSHAGLPVRSSICTCGAPARRPYAKCGGTDCAAVSTQAPPTVGTGTSTSAGDGQISADGAPAPADAGEPPVDLSDGRDRAARLVSARDGQGSVCPSCTEAELRAAELEREAASLRGELRSMVGRLAAAEAQTAYAMDRMQQVTASSSAAEMAAKEEQLGHADDQATLHARTAPPRSTLYRTARAHAHVHAHSLMCKKLAKARSTSTRQR